jgi:hypothetical protein
MGVFDNKGVQMMLVNMLKAAAPDLALQVEGMAAMVREFNDRLISVQINQRKILELLEAQNERPGSNASDGSAEISRRNAG